MTNKETLCTGCGATVTQSLNGDLRDTTGSRFCLHGIGAVHGHWIVVALPPVAIKPEAAPQPDEVLAALMAAIVCQSCAGTGAVRNECMRCMSGEPGECKCEPMVCPECDGKTWSTNAEAEPLVKAIFGEILFPAVQTSPQVVAKPEVSEPTPGSIWLDEGKDSDSLRFVFVANNGRNATCISIKKSDGSIHSINLNGYIVSDCKPMDVQK